MKRNNKNEHATDKETGGGSVGVELLTLVSLKDYTVSSKRNDDEDTAMRQEV